MWGVTGGNYYGCHLKIRTLESHPKPQVYHILYWVPTTPIPTYLSKPSSISYNQILMNWGGQLRIQLYICFWNHRHHFISNRHLRKEVANSYLNKVTKIREILVFSFAHRHDVSLLSLPKRQSSKKYAFDLVSATCSLLLHICFHLATEPFEHVSGRNSWMASWWHTNPVKATSLMVTPPKLSQSYGSKPQKC